MPDWPLRVNIRDPTLEAERRISEAGRASATELELSGLGLASIPNSLLELTSLRGLYLSKNQLTWLPKNLSKLTQLRKLRLDFNFLKSLPEALGQLTNLETLTLTGNPLASLPRSFGNLSALEELILWDNLFTSVPISLRALRELRLLALGKNPIESVPEWIGELSALEILHLEDTHAEYLPEQLKKLTNLHELYLHGNEKLGLPPEVLGPTYSSIQDGSRGPANPVEILEYYFQIRAARRPLNEAKLILIGHGGVGKTSLVRRLVHGTFNQAEKKTRGINITQWPIKLRAREKARLNIWDFGGQEIMHSTHQFFLTKRSLYLLVLNGRQGHEDADAEYWMRLIRSFGEESPVVIVLNKINEHPFDLNRRALTQKFTSIHAFVETDCKDDQGISQLRGLIRRETGRLEHLRDAFPSSWFAIKDRLAGMRESYVSFEQYRNICTKLGESDRRSQESLAFSLHSLGIALNFKDDPRLRDTHVLNPHWVTNGIYTILNARRLADKKGVLGVEHLSKILDRGSYPKKMHSFLFDLMRKFELCFSFPEASGRYLVPELLDKQQSVDAARFISSECLNFQYHYPILPEGILPRFIVRTHVLSAGQPRWRTGVILEFEGNRALVKADVQDRRVFIAITGQPDGRRRLLAVIRSDFEHIHSSFRFQPQEMVAVPDHPDVLVSYRELLVMEKNDLQVLPKVVGSEVLQLEVKRLLNGVDLEGARRFPRKHEESERALRLFYCYSSKDEKLRDELDTHLKLLERRGLIASWHDRRIVAGEEWEVEIDENLERADIILLLVSSDFIASDYCYNIEMRRALVRHKAGKARVVPVVVRDVDWSGAPFGNLQALPRDGKAVTTWSNKDTAWRDVGKGLEDIVKERWY